MGRGRHPGGTRGHGGRSRHGGTGGTGAVVVNLVAVLALAGCSGAAPAADDPEPTASSPAEVAPVEAAPTSALTGLPLDAATAAGPVLVTKIDNTRSARPQAGLGAADLVVEELVEGGSTRLAVFFQSSYPDEVGPVRSMRATDIGIVPADDDTLIVTSGAASRTISRITGAGLSYVEEGAPGFSRSSSRAVPYNLFADLTEVVDGVDGDGERPDDYLPWGTSPAYATGDPATEVDVTFSRDHTTSWELDGERYEVVGGYAGDGDAFSADTVLVLEVDVVDAGYRDPAGNPVPESVLEGTGTATVLHAGRAVEATWSKASTDAPFELEAADGTPLAVPPGRTWIELVPTSTGSLSYD